MNETKSFLTSQTGRSSHLIHPQLTGIFESINLPWHFINSKIFDGTLALNLRISTAVRMNDTEIVLIGHKDQLIGYSH